MAKQTEYGKPTYARAILERVGIGDGWGNPKKAKEPPKKAADPSIGGAVNAIQERKKMLAEYANGGPVRKGKGFKKKGC
jgi:hypothetical protein